MEYTHGRYRLEWVELGEGRDGDYDPTDPDDYPLLRADLYGDGEPLDGGSYCTGAAVGTAPATLDRLALALLEQLPPDPADFRRGVMARWTWETATRPDDGRKAFNGWAVLPADDPSPF